MAKYPHRIFEMYEFRDEAVRALTPRIEKPATEATEPEAWSFTHLAVSRSAGVTLVEFKRDPAGDEETVGVEFDKLGDWLGIDSRVVLDFTGVTVFGSPSINALVHFREKLRTKGSQLAICCLEPATRKFFFADRSPQTN